jgi:phosphate acetyltransferase
MTNTIMIVPASDKVEVTKISLALTEAFKKQRHKTLYLQPIQQKSKRNNQIIEHKDILEPMDISYAEHLLSHGWINELLEEIVSKHEYCCKKADLIIVRGLSYLPGHPCANKLNVEIANALNAKVIILAAADQKSRAILEDQILITAHDYAKRNILGCIINRIEVPADFIPANVEVISYIPYKKRPKISKKAIINFMAKHFDTNWLNEVAKSKPNPCLTPPMFRHQLVQKAHAANKTIVLPESSDVRVLKAAAICARRKIANCVLLGKANEIQQIAAKNAIKLNEKIKIIEPSEKLINRYVEPMVNLRKHKGLTIELAKESLQDPVVLATMMLQRCEIDGLVSGAIHTTANTVRPALQLIKTIPNVSLVSSIFFMCLPDQVLVYGDCAVNPNPNSKELAEIAIESADSAALFGIDPKVAMISYSTGSSGQGPDVEKVREATAIVKSKRPDIIIDGPLQYDAAIIEDVAKQKAPESPVAGQATVCIFPDLDTGNAIYKAVQRSSNILSIGPMLQGLRKPVNDLSRGCLVEDIVFTVALTAIQATHKE